METRWQRRPLLARSALSAWVGALAACSSNGVTRSRVPPPASSVRARAPRPAEIIAASKAPTPEPVAAVAALALEVRAWQFDAVAPQRATAISGTSDRDVWFASEQALYHYDGQSVELVDANVCNPYQVDQQKFDVYGMYVDTKTVILYGAVPTTRESDSGFVRERATRPRTGGNWHCEREGPSFTAFALGSCGKSFWQLSYLYDGILRYGQYPLQGPPVNSAISTAFWRSCSGPVWISVGLDEHNPTTEVWEHNGRTWHSIGSPPDHVKALYGVISGTLWAVGVRNWTNTTVAGTGDSLLRYEKGAWYRKEVPAGFSAESILGVNSERIWFFGRHQATRLTQSGFDQRPLTFDEVGARWVSPSGSVWLSCSLGVGRLLE